MWDFREWEREERIRDEVREEYAKEIADLKTKIAEINAEIAERKANIANKKAENDALKAKIAAYGK